MRLYHACQAAFFSSLLGQGIGKVMVFLLISSILRYWLGPIAFFPNFIVWTVGFKVAFHLDWGELLALVITYIIVNWILTVVFMMIFC